jgi:hypothetical protein
MGMPAKNTLNVENVLFKKDACRAMWFAEPGN